MKKKLVMLVFTVALVLTACTQNSELEQEIGDNKENEDKGVIENVFTVDSSARCGELITFTSDTNEYVENLSQDGHECVSVVVDLDHDGETEAFVIEGVNDGQIAEETNDEYWLADSLIFVDEIGNVQVLEDFAGADIAVEQYLVDNGDLSYLCLNGLMGVDGIGQIYYLKDDKLEFVEFDSLLMGNKYFAGPEDLVLVAEDYRMWFDIKVGSSISESTGTGHSYLPYVLKLVENKAVPYPSKEMTLEQVNEICYFDINPYLESEEFQFIYRDNGELDINYAINDGSEYDLMADVYYLVDGSWVKSTTIEGYFDIVPYEANSWDFLYKEMK